MSKPQTVKGQTNKFKAKTDAASPNFVEMLASKQAPQLIQLPVEFKPEDITIDSIRGLSTESFPLWAVTSGAEVDGHKVDFDKHRYLLPIYMDNHSEIVWQKAAQLGATVYMLLRSVWWLRVNQGRKAGLYFPNKDMVEMLSQDRLNPMLRSIPDVWNIINEAEDQASRMTMKKIGSSTFYLFHLGGKASKDSVPLDFVTFDEVRLCSAQDIDQALERVSHSSYKLKIFMSTAGMPNCFSGDTTVIVRNKESGAVTKRSFKELENTYEQYEALSYNRLGGYRPRWRPILGVFNQGKREMVKVTLEGGHRITCTPDHPFALSAPNLPMFGKRSFVPISEIPRYPKLGHKPAPERVYTIQDIPASCGAPFSLSTFEFFGIYLAEGTIQDGGIYIWQKADRLPALVDAVVDWAEDNDVGYTAHDDHIYLKSVHKKRPDVFEACVSMGGTASMKHIPELLMGGNKAQLRCLLHGFMLGDGHIRADSEDSNKEFDLYTSSKQLADDLCFVGLKAGIPLSRTTKDRVDAEVIIHGEHLGHCNHVSHQLAYNSNSHRLEELLPGMGGMSVREVVPAEPEDAWDLSIDQDNWFFLAESGALVHNCDINARFLGGSQHVWHVACGCKDGCDLPSQWPDCVVDDPKRGLHLRCTKCGWVIKDTQNGRYVAHNPGASYHSYRCSQLNSKFISLKEIWDFYQRTTNIKEFYNAKLGLPYIDEENQPVKQHHCDDCVEQSFPWGEPHAVKHTAMGVDQGAGYCFVVIADVEGNRKRIRHVELIESDNPAYRDIQGKKLSPFVRMGELMEEYGVRVCVCDAMPNANDALQFAQDHPGRVWLAFYTKGGTSPVAWKDRLKTPPAVAKAGPFLKFKYIVFLNRYLSMDAALSAWSNQEVLTPEPRGLLQVARSESTGRWEPEHPLERLHAHLQRLVRQYTVTNEETGEGRMEWVYAGKDPHLAHAWNYCNIATERLRKSVIFTFA